MYLSVGHIKKIKSQFLKKKKYYFCRTIAIFFLFWPPGNLLAPQLIDTLTWFPFVCLSVILSQFLANTKTGHAEEEKGVTFKRYPSVTNRVTYRRLQSQLRINSKKTPFSCLFASKDVFLKSLGFQHLIATKYCFCYTFYYSCKMYWQSKKYFRCIGV